MKIYFANEKGGSGKTTTLLHISLYLKFYLDNLKLYIIDTDLKQKAIRKIMIKRVKNNLMSIDLVKSEKIDDVLKTTLDENTFLLIDGRGNITQEDVKYLEASDLVIVPCGVSFLDLESTKEYITFLKSNDIKFKVLFTKVNDKEKIEEARKFLDTNEIFESYLPLNDKYSEIFEDGKTSLDESFVNVYKWQMKKQVGCVVAELLETINFKF